MAIVGVQELRIPNSVPDVKDMIGKGLLQNLKIIIYVNMDLRKVYVNTDAYETNNN